MGGGFGQLHPTGHGFVVEGVDSEGAMPPPSVVFLHVVTVVRSVGDAPEQIPGEWAQWFLQMDISLSAWVSNLAIQAQGREECRLGNREMGGA